MDLPNSTDNAGLALEAETAVPFKILNNLSSTTQALTVNGQGGQ
jgi:hypothetical protein